MDKIPEWILEYDKKGYRSSAGRAINFLLEVISKHNTDLCEFAEWCSINHWIKYKAEKELWFNDRTFREMTTSQLREQWEIETGRRKP